MEGLDLFNPVPGACKDVSDSSSDEMSSVEGSPESGSDSDPDWGDKKGKNSSRHKGGDLWQSDKKETNNSSLLVKKVSDVTSGSFQVEKVSLRILCQLSSVMYSLFIATRTKNDFKERAKTN